MGSDYFDETTDLYLEILRSAQKVEDRKLIRLIGTRLREIGQIIPSTDESCEIILFPGAYSHVVLPRPAPASSPVPESAPFWPRFAFRQTVWALSGCAALILGGLLIGS